MSKRNQHAVAAQQGACNPIPLIRALHEGLNELREERPQLDTAPILDDPALRLIVHQLAHLFRVHAFDGGLDYLTACEAVGMPAMGAQRA